MTKILDWVDDDFFDVEDQIKQEKKPTGFWWWFFLGESQLWNSVRLQKKIDLWQWNLICVITDITCLLRYFVNRTKIVWPKVFIKKKKVFKKPFVKVRYLLMQVFLTEKWLRQATKKEKQLDSWVKIWKQSSLACHSTTANIYHSFFPIRKIKKFYLKHGQKL